jgi:hypothetical protein
MPSMNDKETADKLKEMKEYDFAKITINSVVDKDDDYMNDFAKAELEFKKRKQQHEEYLKKKEEQEVVAKIEHDKRMKRYNKKTGIPSYETESDDSDYSAKEKADEADKFPGEWVKPFAYLVSMCPYDFQQYVPLAHNVSQKKRDKETIWVSEQHVPVGKKIAEKYVWDRLKFLNQIAESTKDPIFIVSIISYK